MGHFERELPAGYREALETGDASRVVEVDDQARLEILWQRIR